MVKETNGKTLPCSIFKLKCMSSSGKLEPSPGLTFRGVAGLAQRHQTCCRFSSGMGFCLGENASQVPLFLQKNNVFFVVCRFAI